MVDTTRDELNTKHTTHIAIANVLVNVQLESKLRKHQREGANEKNIQYGVILPCIQKEAMILMGALYEMKAGFGRNSNAPPVTCARKEIKTMGEGKNQSKWGGG